MSNIECGILDVKIAPYPWPSDLLLRHRRRECYIFYIQNSKFYISIPGMLCKMLDATGLSWHTHTCRREHPRMRGWKTPPGPRGSNGIQTTLVGVLFPAVFLLRHLCS